MSIINICTKGLYTFGFLYFVVLSSVFAQTTRFEVEVDPDVITAGEFTDLTIKAVDESGNVDIEYRGDVTFSIEEIIDPLSSDVVLPNDGFYSFKSSDQGVKIFSKGLTIKKKGDYTISVVELLNEEAVNGEATLKVNQEGGEAEVGTLTVSSPIPDEELVDDKLNVIAKTSLGTTPIIVEVDGVKVQEGLSDATGNINMFISGISEGKHTLLVKSVNLEGTVTSTSGDIPFVYSPLDHSALFVGLEVLPSNKVIVGDKVTFKIETSDLVDSVTIKLGSSNALPTQKIGDGQFEKELLMDTEGVFSVDLGMSVNGDVIDSKDVESVTVSKDVQEILTAAYTADNANDKVDISRTYTGRVDFFKLSYGLDRGDLDLSLTTTQPKSTLILSKPTETRYAQISPVDKSGKVVGKSSEILRINPLRDPDPVCGNGIVQQGEECDDNNIVNNDGCNSVCRLETALCGNRRLETGEECDDGNTRNGDGCSKLCKIELSICGNGSLESGEECDDGNTRNGDGCTSSCKILIEEPDPTPITLPTTPAKKTCSPGGIVLKTKQIGSKYYLYWDAVQNADKYLIYRRDTQPRSVSTMQLVGETVEPLFEYPFDPSAQVDQYARYAVEAMCENDDKKLIGDFTKIKVGPEDTLLLVLLIALLMAGMWKLSSKNYNTRREIE